MANGLKNKDRHQSYEEIEKIIKRLEEDEIKFIESQFKRYEDNNKPIYQKLYYQIKENEKIVQTQKDNFETLREKLEEYLGQFTRRNEIESKCFEEQLKERIATVKNLRRKGILTAAKRNLDNAIEFAVKNKLNNCFYELYKLRVDIYFLLKIENKPSKQDLNQENSYVRIIDRLYNKKKDIFKKEVEDELVKQMPFEIIDELNNIVDIFINDLFLNNEDTELNNGEIPFRSLALEYFRLKKDYNSFLNFYKLKKKELNQNDYIDLYDLRALLLEIDRLYNLQILGKYDEYISRANEISFIYKYDKRKLYSVLGYYILGKVNDIEIEYSLRNQKIPFPNSIDEILHFSNSQIPSMSIRFELNNLLLTFLSSLGNSYKSGFESCHKIISELVDLDFVKNQKDLYFDLYMLDILIEQYNNPENAYDLVFKFKDKIDSKSVTILNLVKDKLDNTNESMSTVYKRHKIEWEHDNPIHSAIKFFLEESDK